MITIGAVIPEMDFEIFQNEKITRVKFSDYRKKWLVLLFYPGDFTFVCPTELGDAASLYENFQKLGAEVISVSTDSKYVHKAWHDTSPIIKTVKYPMASDPTGRICREFGAYIEKDGLAQRASFIIDPEGKVRAIDIHDNSIGRNMGEIYRKLQAAQYVDSHPGEVCPANWKPGDKTLLKGLNLVGKI